MNIPFTAVKIGTSRQVVVPKKFYDELRLQPGDYLEVKRNGKQLVLSPKILIDKHLEARIAEGLNDIKEGRVYGPFKSAKAMIHSLHHHAKQRKLIK